MDKKKEDYSTDAICTAAPHIDGLLPLRCLNSAAKELDIDILPILKHFDLTPEQVSQHNGWIDGKKYADLLDMIAEMFDLPQFGFVVAQQDMALDFTLENNLVKWSPDLRTALYISSKYVSYRSDIVGWNVHEEEEYATVIRSDTHPQFFSARQLHVVGIIQAVRKLQMICGPDWHPVSISFTHDIPKTICKRYERYYRSPILTNQNFNGITFNSSYLNRETPTADADKFKVISTHLENISRRTNTDSSLSLQVRNQIRKRLDSGHFNIQVIAQSLSRHTKKLQRELAIENTSFSQLLLDERLTLAKYYLRESTIDLTTISEILGYNNVSAFSRAFINNVGVSPSSWKEKEDSQIV
jgi:AraC-like DNA-binding protein